MTADQIGVYFDRLWPILRSITGDGVRETHDILSELIPLERIEVPSGTCVFDWQVPKEWVVREAYLIAPDGQRILDVHDNNLHLLNYSVPFRGTVHRNELDSHLFSLPDQPDAIPYVTSYYSPRWGFCLSQRQRDALPDGIYRVVIDTDHIDGTMTLGEAVLRGRQDREVLISTNTCHPSLANNELSGPLVSAFLYRRLAALEERQLTYRFVFLPETIGSLAYLWLRGDHLRKHMVAGYTVTCVGDAGRFTYKRSRIGNGLPDRAAEHVLSRKFGSEFTIMDFFPDEGSDERQYCSPGFNLPVGSLMRTMYGKYAEYHTSLDNRDFVSFESMVESVEAYYQIIRVLDMNATYKNIMPYGEPQLGKRGLYPTLGTKGTAAETSAIMWLLSSSGGDTDLLAIADKSGHQMDLLSSVAQKCLNAGLLERVS